MKAQRKIETLQAVVIQKRELDRHRKDLTDSIKINWEQIDNTIMDGGDIGACRDLLVQIQDMALSKKELGLKIKGLNDRVESIILGEGADDDAQGSIEDYLDRVGTVDDESQEVQ